MGIGNGEDQFIEAQHQYASLLDKFIEVKGKHDQLLATHEHDLQELSTLRESKSALQGRITVLQRELQACKDDLFRIQPMSQVPDSTIAQRFESLDAQICDWIGTEISGFLDAWQAEYPGDQPKLFHHDGYFDTQNFLAEYSEMGGEYVIRHVIHRHLQKKLFDDGICLFSLGAKDVSFLNIIEHGMSRLEPSRGELLSLGTARVVVANFCTRSCNNTNMAVRSTYVSCQNARILDAAYKCEKAAYH